MAFSSEWIIAQRKSKPCQIKDEIIKKIGVLLSPMLAASEE
jgi:hypothetical protein